MNVKVEVEVEVEVREINPQINWDYDYANVELSTLDSSLSNLNSRVSILNSQFSILVWRLQDPQKGAKGCFYFYFGCSNERITFCSNLPKIELIVRIVRFATFEVAFAVIDRSCHINLNAVDWITYWIQIAEFGILSKGSICPIVCSLGDLCENLLGKRMQSWLNNEIVLHFYFVSPPFSFTIYLAVKGVKVAGVKGQLSSVWRVCL